MEWKKFESFVFKATAAHASKQAHALLIQNADSISETEKEIEAQEVCKKNCLGISDITVPS